MLAVFAFVAAGDVRAETPTTRPADGSPVTIPASQQFDLASADGRAYRIFIAEPSSDGSVAAPETGFATLYVLDANAMFATAVDTVRFQRGQIPAIVVGIGYPADATLDTQRRYYDFSPPTPPENIWSSGTSPRAKPEETGGEDAFLAFIETVVKPEVAKRFKVDASRQAILGHSLAGRFVLHALFTKPDAFSHYIAISPSVWWNEKSILAEANSFIAARKTEESKESLLVMSAEFEQKIAPGTPPARADFFRMARMVDNARELVESLEPLAEKGVESRFIEFADENHGSIVPVAISRGIRFALTPPAKP